MRDLLKAHSSYLCNKTIMCVQQSTSISEACQNNQCNIEVIEIRNRTPSSWRHHVFFDSGLSASNLAHQSTTRAGSDDPRPVSHGIDTFPELGGFNSTIHLEVPMMHGGGWYIRKRDPMGRWSSSKELGRGGVMVENRFYEEEATWQRDERSARESCFSHGPVRWFRPFSNEKSVGWFWIRYSDMKMKLISKPIEKQYHRDKITSVFCRINEENLTPSTIFD